MNKEQLNKLERLNLCSMCDIPMPRGDYYTIRVSKNSMKSNGSHHDRFEGKQYCEKCIEVEWERAKRAIDNFGPIYS